MNTITDFEDLLGLLEKKSVRYLIVGGLAFIYHAKPRYTKDIDIWLDSTRKNIENANEALNEFGSPYLLTLPPRQGEILQLGLPPNRIDLILSIEGFRFPTAWKKREKGLYGKINANWIDLNSLLNIKKSIPEPRHQEDARVLEQVRKLRNRNK
ncbi:MAG: hypothetical protein GF398_08250 [Chitinivibrionales bacterium]|nr:hypothetical protein [Chitinivibrionales bacterium]